MKNHEFQMFEKILKTYEGQDFVSSLSELEQVRNLVPPSTYFYNKAVLKYKMGEMAESRALFEKSIANGNIGVEARHNLNLVKSKLDLDESETFLNSQWLHVDYMFYSALIILLIPIAFFLRRKFKVLILVTCSVLAVSILTKEIVVGGELAVISPDAKVYEGPSEVFKTEQVFPVGLKVLVVKKQSGWAFIRYPESFAGWVLENKLIKLDN